MNEVVQNSSQSSAANPSGVGAVLFDNSQLLSTLNENMNSAAASLEQNKKDQAAAFKETLELAKGFNVSMKGALPADIPYLTQQAQTMNKARTMLLALGHNPDSPAFGQVYLAASNAKENLEGDVDKSIEWNKGITNVGIKSTADIMGKQENDQQYTTDQVAAALNKPLNERPDFNESNFFRPKPKDLNVLISDLAKNKSYETQDISEEGPNIIQNTHKKNFNLDQMSRQVVSLAHQNSTWANSTNKEWENFKSYNKDGAQTMIDHYVNGPEQLSPLAAEARAKDDFLATSVANAHASVLSGQKVVGLTFDAKKQLAYIKESAGGQTELNKAMAQFAPHARVYALAWQDPEKNGQSMRMMPIGTYVAPKDETISEEIGGKVVDTKVIHKGDVVPDYVISGKILPDGTREFTTVGTQKTGAPPMKFNDPKSFVDYATMGLSKNDATSKAPEGVWANYTKFGGYQNGNLDVDKYLTNSGNQPKAANATTPPKANSATVKIGSINY